MRRRETAGTARFLTFSCYHGFELFRNPRVADRFVERLTRASADASVDVLAWVVMPEHVHLIAFADPADTSMTRFTHGVKRPFALEILNRWRALGAAILPKLLHGTGHRFWQAGGGHDRNVVGTELLEKIRYVHLNPVRRGLVERSAAYRWSSAAAYEGLPYVGGGAADRVRLGAADAEAPYLTEPRSDARVAQVGTPTCAARRSNPRRRRRQVGVPTCATRRLCHPYSESQ